MSPARFWTTLVVQLKASPGKASVLGVLTVVLLVLVGRLIWRSPSSAEAAAPAAVPVVDTTMLGAMPTSTPSPTDQQRPPLPALPDQPPRDPFEAEWIGLPRVVQEDPVAAPDDEEEVAEVPLPNLTLELTLTPPGNEGNPAAVINGRTVRVGSAIDGYLVESISPGQVVLSTQRGDRFALRMN